MFAVGDLAKYGCSPGRTVKIIGLSSLDWDGDVYEIGEYSYTVRFEDGTLTEAFEYELESVYGSR
jgi:hypothetical protein